MADVWRSPADAPFLAGGGDTGRLIRAHDWAATAIGPPDGWPQPLRTLVGVMLASGQPMFVAWGPGRTLLYNDAYAVILAAKHPEALGRDLLDVWHEIRADLAPIVERAYRGEPVHMDDIALRMNRRGYEEETHFAFSYTPVRDETGAVAGFFCPCMEVTERVLAGRRLRESEERLRRILDGMTEGFGLLAPDFTILELNAEALRMDGRPREAIVGRSHWDVHPGSEDTVLGRALKAAMAERRPVSFEHRYAGADGRTQWLDMRAIPTADGTLALFWRDVTDRKAAEEALRESEARYRTLFETIESGFCVVEVDLEGRDGRIDYRVVEANPAFFRQTGFPEAVLGRWLREAAPALEEHWFETYGRVARTGEPARFEEGSDLLGRWFDVHAVRTGAQEDRRVAILFSDITARRRAETRLRELNETLEQQVAERTAERDRMWDISPDLMVVIDFTGHVLRVNPAWTAVLGYAPDDVIGRHVNAFVLPEDHARTVEAYEMAAAGGRPRVVNRIRHMDGTTRWIAWVAAPAQQMTYATGRDVTRQMAAEEHLRHAQKMEAIGHLTGGVAHDFNNLLTPIVGGLDALLRRGVGGGRERRLIDGAMQSAERARTLVQRLLAFARRQPLRPTAVDVAALVQGMAYLIDSTTGPRIRMEVAASPGLPPATADANQLEMALLNLCVNARDAMPDGGTLRIVVAEERVGTGHPSRLEPGRYVRLAVEDDGTGMDDATLARAVEPFFSTKGVGKGTGLGLSMAHGLASQLGGALTIRSRPGAGTTVDLLLPVSVTPPGPVAPPAVAAPPGGAAVGTVLLVDDEDLVRMSTADMLLDLGYTVVEAGSAAEALRLTRSGLRPDLLVTDHLMPGVSGTDLARRLRAERPDLPVLVVTGYAEGDGVAPELARLTKPFRKDELAARLARLAVG